MHGIAVTGRERQEAPVERRGKGSLSTIFMERRGTLGVQIREKKTTTD